MRTRTTTAEDLFNRPWRSAPPFRQRASLRRQVLMALLLVALSGAIGCYWYITDSNRLRQMAERYLSGMVGGRVEVGRATLSIFEGLRLDDVRVSLDDEARLDNVVFTAQTFLVRYSVAALLEGELEATQIVALEPHVRLCENMDTGKWNYQGLGQRKAPSGGGPPAAGPPLLPEILLRGGQVDYSRILRGRYEPLGKMAIEGQLNPGSEANRYAFELESRGLKEAIGPSLKGSVNLGTHEVEARLRWFDFGGPARMVLPAVVQQMLARHELSGRIDVPVVYYRPAPEGGKPTFRVEIDLDRVNFALHGEDWLATKERQELETARNALVSLRAMGFHAAGSVDRMIEAYTRQPIQLSWVTGKLLFTQDQIEVRNLSGWVEKNSFSIDGRIDGYDPESPADLRVVSKELYIPQSPHYIASLPHTVREVYERFRPTGTAKMSARLHRAVAGAAVDFSGELEVLDGAFLYSQFAYPLEHVSGKIKVGRDPQTGWDRIDLCDLHGRGIPGSANTEGTLSVNGYVSPLNDQNGIHLKVVGRNVTLDEGLFRALGPQTRKTMRGFAGPGREFPRLHGAFECYVERPPGPVPNFTTDVDLHIEEAAGAYTVFPYPLEGLTGTIRVREDYIDVENVRMKRGAAEVAVDGRVLMPGGGRVDPDLKVTARQIPIDRALLDALPRQERAWVEKVGLGGRIDIDGRIIRGEMGQSEKGPDFGFELEMALHEGTLWPVEKKNALEAIEADGHLNGQRLTVRKFTAKRGQADVEGNASVNWSSEDPTVAIVAHAKNLALDEGLYRMLPADARAGWDVARPEGSVDADITYGTGGGRDGYEVKLRPRQLAATPTVAPYRLEKLKGEVVISPSKVLLKEITGVNGSAEVGLSGEGETRAGGKWTLGLTGRKLPVDEALRKALPASLAELIQGMKLQGVVDVDCPKLEFTAAPAPAPALATVPAAQTAPAATAPSFAGRVDFKTRVTFQGASLDVAIPLSDVTGTLDLEGRSEGGRLVECQGRIEAPTLSMGDRPAEGLRCQIAKPPDRDGMQLSKLEVKLAGGELAGQIELDWPESGPARYAVGAVLRDADVRELAGETAKDAQGRITASLALEGQWGDPKVRRGRGDVLVRGKELYRIPLVLGLLQITNLALPISSPFNEATTRYSVQGERVTFEQIELRSGTMMMQGSGWLDYGTRKVRMTFTTDNPNWPAVPLLHELLKGAREELLQIHVNGTVQEPQVKARSFNMFTTTVDEVLKGGENGKGGKKK